MNYLNWIECKIGNLLNSLKGVECQNEIHFSSEEGEDLGHLFVMQVLLRAE